MKRTNILLSIGTILLVLFANIMVKGQNASIGIYTIYEADSEYYLLYGGDTTSLSKYSLTIKFKDHVSGFDKDAFKMDFNLTYVRETSGSYVNYRLSNTSNYISICDSIYYDTRIEEFILDFKLYLHGFYPDDPEHADQWYLERIGVYGAWDITMGSGDVIVAVIDQGLFLDHDDIGDDNEILENIYHNPGEDEWYYWDHPNTGDGYEGEDDNGKIDDWKGWNFANRILNVGWVEDNNVIPEQSWMDHGNAVSGIIAAKTNNNYDMAGIAGGNFAENQGGAKILPIKVIDVTEQQPGWWVEEFYSSALAAAIDYAVERGANIINMSLGVSDSFMPPSFVNAVKASIDNAFNSNVVVVASVGNGYSGTILFPANYEHVIAVGSTDSNDDKADFSNIGPEIDIVAPGVDILTLNNADYEDMDGTSMSAPMVSATAALMLSVNPDLTNIQIREILRNTAEKVGDHNYQNGWNQYMGYGRLNTNYAVCAALETTMDPNPIIVSTNGDSWDEPVISLHGIVVEAGNTLTITSTVFMGNDASFIIEQGATVILDGGTLTNYKLCGHENNKWQGVRVWGNPSQSQYINPNDGIQHQGKLIISDGVIENAVVAVRLSKDGTWTSTTGGIVQANGAVFRNNARSLLALNYRNYSPGYPTQTLDNASYFKYCDFEVNSDYLNLPDDDDFYKHIDMNNVDGIQFKACNFSLEGGVLGVSPSNKAIQSNNAGFDVMAICTTPPGQDCIDYDKCTFTGFNRAIAATATNSTYTFWVNRAVFNNNVTGIYASLVNNISIVLSDFNIAINTSDASKCEAKGQKSSGYGIDLNGCTGFAIEENHFAPANTGGYYTGIRIAETQATDQVYKNYFDGLSYGNYAVGENYRQPNYFFNGLTYYCNENTANYADFFVEPDNLPQKISGIQSKQGNDDLVSGNKFTSSGATWHFYNGGDYLVGYYFCDYCANENPDDDKEFQLTDKPKNFDNDCPSHYGDGGIGGGSGIALVLTPEQKQETEMEYAANLTDYNNVKTLYDNLKDGGNTDATLTDIETAWPNDMWELRSKLLGDSPHLSMEVLKTAAGKTEVLPESIIFEIMAANPDELKKEELIKYLEDKEDPLPEYMITILKQVAEGTTYKTVLEQQMAHYNQKKTRAAHDIIRSILNDEVMDYTELRNWLDNIGGKRADEQIIGTYLAENNYTDAMAIADMMPTVHNYPDHEIAEHAYFMEMLDLQILLSQQQRDISELENNEIDNLVEIAENSEGTAGMQAKGILEFAYGHHYCNCLDISGTDGYKSSGVINLDDLAKAYGLDVTTEPNPAKDWVAFNFTLPNSNPEGVIEISDISGKSIVGIPINGTQGQKVWDTRKIKPGVYFYTLNVSGFNKSGKIVISK